jgi:hypothetical protein
MVGRAAVTGVGVVAEITELDFEGDWRISVTSKEAGFDQRVLIANVTEGTVVVPGTPGASRTVHGVGTAAWQLRIQHDDGSGWQDSWLQPGSKSIVGSQIFQGVGSEDITTPESDRDFNDLVIRLDKVGMVDLPTRPSAIRPTAMQMMPDGIFETVLGRYFLAVTVRNIWSVPWPAQASVGLTARCRNWLAAAGIVVVDAWAPSDLDVVAQEMVGAQVRVGALGPWQTRVVYFKVDVSAARPDKHTVEVEVTEPVMPDPDHPNRRASGSIFVTRTTFDPDESVFVSECDRGRLTAAVRELTVDFHTFKMAVGRARELFRPGEDGTPGGGAPGGGGPCAGGVADIDRLRRGLQAFLAGREVDLCELIRLLQCVCACDGTGPGDLGGPWAGEGATGLEFVAFPTAVDYRVDYNASWAGQHGPIPFDDPWWKVLLVIVAIILTVASAAADLANRSDDVVIGSTERALFNPFDTQAEADAALAADPEFATLDVALVLLNGNRSLTPALFSYLDAASGELNTTPVVSLDGRVDTAGTFLTNAQIEQIVQDLVDRPDDPAAKEAARLWKSGARTGVTYAVLKDVIPVRNRCESHDPDECDDEENIVYFTNQLMIGEDPDEPMGVSDSGDSGSLWLQRGTNAVVGLNHAGSRETNTATANRIQDVLEQLAIRFA